MTRGHGSDVNPLDGDRIFVEIELRDDHVYTIGVRVNQPPGDLASRGVGVRLGPYSTRSDSCQTARRACTALAGLVLGRTADEAARLGATDLLRTLMAATFVDAIDERCVLTAIGALRSALIDAHVTALAEATLEAKKLSLK